MVLDFFELPEMLDRLFEGHFGFNQQMQITISTWGFRLNVFENLIKTKGGRLDKYQPLQLSDHVYMMNSDPHHMLTCIFL